MKFRIEIEVLENGYEVEIPDIEAYNKAEADAEKAKKQKGNGPYISSPYMGDFMKVLISAGSLRVPSSM